jgi:cyanophycinase
MLRQILLIACLVYLPASRAGADGASGKPDSRGTLILGGGGIQNSDPGSARIRQRFVELAGGPEANFVVIRSNKDTLPVDMLILPDPGAAQIFGVKSATSLCTHKRTVANSEGFVAPIRKANAVWITGGKPDNLAPVYCSTLVQQELKALLDRGGVIGGESAGAMILASHITDSIKVPPGLKAATDCYDGFGFISSVVIAPHIIKMGWTESLVPIVAANPNLLGIGIDECAAIEVHGESLEVIGNSRVAIYDNKDHEGKQYYFLSPGDRFDLAMRRKSANASATTHPTSQP